MPNSSTPFQFLKQAIRDNRVAHVCIHNQYAFLLHDTLEGTDDRKVMENFCHNLGDFTNQLSGKVMTVNAQYHIGALNTIWRTMAPGRNIHFGEYYPETFHYYDSQQFKVIPELTEERSGCYIDLVNQNYNQYVFIDAYSDVFNGSEKGTRLVSFLKENGKDVIVGSGLYSQACVPSSLCSAVNKGFTVYAITDQIFTHPYVENCERVRHADVIKTYPGEIHRVTSKKLLNLIQ